MIRFSAALLFLLSFVSCVSWSRSEAQVVAGDAQAQPSAQTPAPVSAPGDVATNPASAAPAIAANAPHMSKQTRFEIIRDFETQLVYSRTPFPMGMKGLRLKDGVITPNGDGLRQALTLYGPAVKPGDPAQISYVRIKDDFIHFELNGGPIRRKKWYQHIEVSGNGGPVNTTNPNEVTNNPHGTFVDLYFDHYVPEMTARQLRDLLYPVLDFNAKNKEQAYLDTVPPKVKEAILNHHVLVGMNEEMVIHAKGRPPKKVREKDGETEYEEWIYGEPPQDVDFVRIVGDEVVRVETMKVGGEKIVRTEKEVILDHEDREAKQEQPEVRPANAPTMRRPGEDSDDVPRPAGGPAPMPPVPPPTPPTGPGPGYAGRGYAYLGGVIPIGT